MVTDFGIKQHKKYGLDWHCLGLKSGDIIIFNPRCTSWYYQKTPTNLKPISSNLTPMREYIVEYAYSSRVQIKGDNGRIITIGSGHFEILKNNNLVRC
jgi:hypothetical protein